MMNRANSWQRPHLGTPIWQTVGGQRFCVGYRTPDGVEYAVPLGDATPSNPFGERWHALHLTDRDAAVRVAVAGRGGGVNAFEVVDPEHGIDWPVVRAHGDPGAGLGECSRRLVVCRDGTARKKNPTMRGAIRKPNDRPVSEMMFAPPADGVGSARVRRRSDGLHVETENLGIDFDSADFEKMPGVPLGGGADLPALWPRERLGCVDVIGADGINRHEVWHDDPDGCEIGGDDPDSYAASRDFLSASFYFTHGMGSGGAAFVNLDTMAEWSVPGFVAETRRSWNATERRVDTWAPGAATDKALDAPIVESGRIAALIWSASGLAVAVAGAIHVGPTFLVDVPVRVVIEQHVRADVAADVPKALLPRINSGPRITFGGYTKAGRPPGRRSIECQWTAGPLSVVRERLYRMSQDIVALGDALPW